MQNDRRDHKFLGSLKRFDRCRVMMIDIEEMKKGDNFVVTKFFWKSRYKLCCLWVKLKRQSRRFLVLRFNKIWVWWPTAFQRYFSQTKHSYNYLQWSSFEVILLDVQLQLEMQRNARWQNLKPNFCDVPIRKGLWQKAMAAIMALHNRVYCTSRHVRQFLIWLFINPRMCVS